MAFNKIQHIYYVAIGRVIFEAWNNTTLETKHTREYFEVSTIIYHYNDYVYESSVIILLVGTN